MPAADPALQRNATKPLVLSVGARDQVAASSGRQMTTDTEALMADHLRSRRNPDDLGRRLMLSAIHHGSDAGRSSEGPLDAFPVSGSVADRHNGCLRAERNDGDGSTLIFAVSSLGVDTQSMIHNQHLLPADASRKA